MNEKMTVLYDFILDHVKNHLHGSFFGTTLKVATQAKGLKYTGIYDSFHCRSMLMETKTLIKYDVMSF